MPFSKGMKKHQVTPLVEGKAHILKEISVENPEHTQLVVILQEDKHQQWATLGITLGIFVNSPQPHSLYIHIAIQVH